ncbi:MAG: hypothetical protein HY720_07050 [Planctomycetes bacterium]|nr:hypothetical protein [Planctomycetota bacterium]
MKLPALSSLSLEVKVGQILFLPVRGLSDEPGLARALAGWRELSGIAPGGVLLFGGEAHLAARFLADVQAASRVPLVAAADLERGAAQQFAGATSFPCPMAIAASGDLELARAVARWTAREARAMGVNQIYAPVADVNTEPENPIVSTRAYGDDPTRVAPFVAAAVRGIQEEGLAATAKHFPGHGATRADSHIELPVDPRGKAEIERTDLPAFEAAIREGVLSVMVAHVAYPAFSGDPPLPALLCPEIVTGTLRERMGFGGAVFCDALNMGAVGGLSETELAVRAVRAGIDGLLHPRGPVELAAGLARAVQQGELPGAALSRAVERIFAMKERLPNPRSAAELEERVSRELRTPEALALSRDARARSLTWLGPRKGALPFSPAPRSLDLFLVADPDLQETARLFAAEVARRVPDLALRDLTSGGRPGKPGLVALFSSIRGWKGTASVAGIEPDALRHLVGSGDRARAAIFGPPYLAASLGPDTQCLVTYDAGDLAPELAARALFGEIDAPGRLPVRIG